MYVLHECVVCCVPMYNTAFQDAETNNSTTHIVADSARVTQGYALLHVYNTHMALLTDAHCMCAACTCTTFCD